jgi:uncharacterized protein YndB with AHSA1/START domain
MASKNKPNEIYIERIYNAPVKLVWEAWTDPDQVKEWWGPRGFTLTTHSKPNSDDLKAGSIWSYTMHGPDGVNYPNKTVYHEVKKYARLVYDHGGNDDQPPMFQVTVNFTELKNKKTKMEMWMALKTPEEAEQTKKFIKSAGGNGTWDRLAEFLENNTEDKEVFYINRSFNTSVEHMYDVWTTPEHIAKWLSPTGFTMTFFKADITPGGEAFYQMTNNKDVTMYGKIKYIEMNKPNHIKYIQQFCDKDGNLSKHPLAPTWPAYMLTTIQLEQEDTNQTRVTIKWEPYGDFTSEELSTFVGAKSSMTQGWTGSFDKLEDYLNL